MYKGREITVVIPALNEELSIGLVLDELFELGTCGECSSVISSGTDNQCPATPSLSVASCRSSEQNAVSSLVDQIIVCNNGSTDNTASIALKHGAVVTDEPERGYGAACLAALAVPVKKDIIVFVDADHSVVAEELPQLIDPLFDSADLVIGSRTLGNTEKGALSIPQEFGNRLATALIRMLWNVQVTDLGPFRAISSDALQKLHMSDRRFGWTVEMQVAAIQQSMQTVEVPVSTRQRIGKSKISGTVRGVFAAGHGILGTIFKLYRSGRKSTDH